MGGDIFCVIAKIDESRKQKRNYNVKNQPSILVSKLILSEMKQKLNWFFFTLLKATIF